MTFHKHPQTINTEPIAVVGMSCRLPGALSMDSFWSLLLEGRYNYTELPTDRLNQSLYYNPKKGVSGKTYSKTGAVFDFLERKSSPNYHDALSDDPGHRMSLEVALEACQDAGYSVDDFPHKRAGVFMGFTRGSQIGCDKLFWEGLSPVLGYLNDIESFAALPPEKCRQILREVQKNLADNYAYSESYDAKRLISNLAAWNIARTLKLNGPAMIMDGACSSSLSALAIAARSLSAGDIDAAFVGGASYFSFDSLVLFAQAQSIAADISCPFDDRASGLICGEANVFFLLKKLDKAVADGDRIQGVIRGIGVSSDGKGKSLWAPRSEGQTEAVLRAFQSGANPEHLRFIEAHATSTPLGDPTEISALGTALKQLLPSGRRLHIGSVKANVGHCLESAGVVGMMKAMLMLKHKTIPPQIHLETRNKSISWQDLPIDIATEPMKLEPVEKGKPIQIAVNAFGIGGINVHVVLEEFESSLALQSSQSPKHSKQPVEKPIAVIGMGCVFPGANNIADYWKLLSSGTDPKTELVATQWDRLFPVDKLQQPQVTQNKKLLGGFITNWEYDWKKHKIPPLQIAHANPLQFMILDAVDQAMEDSGYKKKPFDKKRTSVVIGTRFGSDFANALQLGVQMPEIRDALKKSMRHHEVDESVIDRSLNEYEKKFYERLPALRDETGSFTSSTFASRVTKTYDLMGGAICIDSGNAASVAALDAACNMIRSGESAMVICAGAQRNTGSNLFKGLIEDDLFASINCDSLDDRADGIFPGEGVGVVLLKSLEEAQKDGDRIYGIIHGIGAACNTDQASAFESATRFALENANVTADQINHIEIPSLRDKEEKDTLIRSMSSMFDNSAKQNIGIGSVSGQIGNLGGAAGMAMLIKTILTLEHLEVPGVFGLEQIPPLLSGTPFRLSKKIDSIPSCNADGHLFASVMEMDEAEDWLLTYNIILERGTQVSAEERQRLSRQTKTPIISQQPQTVSDASDDADFILPPKPLWAMIFPGQGSQYHGMLKSLSECSPLCREIIASLDDLLKSHDFPTFAEMAWNEPNELGKNVFHTQLSLLVCDTVYVQMLEKMGVHASLYFGHSYGEYPALHAAGAWDFVTAATATRHRCSAIESLQGQPTGMLSTNVEVKYLKQLFHKIHGLLFISNRNTPDQTVVSGELAALKELNEILRREKHVSIILPVPAGFHSPLVKDVCLPLQKVLSTLPIRFPDRAFLSGVTERFEAEPASIREAFIKQMTQPVDFVNMMTKAYRYGIRRFVEVGPRMTLSNMGQKILPNEVKTGNVIFLPCDAPKGKGEQILQQIEKIVTLYQNDISSSEKTKTLNPPVVSVRTAIEPEKTDKSDASQERKNLPLDAPGSYKDLVLPTDVVCCELSGLPYEIGFNMGSLLKQPIRRILRRYADIAGQSYKQLPHVHVDSERIDRMFTNDSLEELRGIAEAAGVPFQALLRHNLSVYPDSMEANVHGHALSAPAMALGFACTYFAGHARDGAFLQGTNIDVPIFRILSGSHIGILQVRRPKGKKPHFVVTGSGFVGGIFGINASGLAVVGASISELPRTPQISNGLLPTLLIEHILAEAGSLEEAVELIRSTPRCASWSLCLTELATRRMVQIEYSGGYLTVRNHLRLAMASNHQQYLTDVLPITPPKALPHSQARLDQLQELLAPNDESFQLSSDQVFSVLRDKFDTIRHGIPRHRTINTIWRIDNILSLMIDADHGVLHLASTDTAHTDSGDPAHRHAVISLYDLLPELRHVLTGSAKTVPAPNKKISKQPKEESNQSAIIIDRTEYARLNTSRHGREPIPVPMKFNRYIPRLIETGIPTQSLQKITGAALIISDDENKLGMELSELLSKRNVRFFLLSPGQSLETIGDELDGMEKECPITHLFFLSPQGSETPSHWGCKTWQREYEQSTVLPIIVLREWLRLMTARGGNFNECAVLASTRLGGSFGLAGQFGSVPFGALAGHLKGFRMELAVANKILRTKIVDTELHQNSKQSADILFFESEHWDAETEITYKNNRRFALRSVLAPLPEQLPEQLPKQLPEQKPAKSKEQETWIITGGARGITAAIARGLGQQRHVKLYLIGSSPLSQIDPAWKKMNAEQLQTLRKEIIKEAVARKEVPSKAWERVEKALEIERNLDALTQNNIDFVYRSCDLTDEKAVHSLLSEIPGEITGIIHGAGFEAAARIEKKKIENIRRTFDVKVKGAETLLTELEAAGKYPKVVLGFSSVSGRFGGVGQIDYCAANEMLSKLLDWYDAEHADCRAVSVQWPAWGEIGMAARPESKMALTAAGLEFMPPNEGIAHVLNEIGHILDSVTKNNTKLYRNEREILISDWNYYKRFYPDDISVPKIPVPPQSGTVNSFFLLGNNADADAIQRIGVQSEIPTLSLSETTDSQTLISELQKFAETETCPTLIVTVPRDPLGGHIPGPKHWQVRVDQSIRKTLDCCRNWIDLARTNKDRSFRLVILTSLADDTLPYIPEGAIILNHLEEWIDADNSVDVRILDFAADAVPEDVAAATLEVCRTEIVPGRCEILFPEKRKRYDFLKEQWGKNWLAGKILPAILQQSEHESVESAVSPSPLIDRIIKNPEGTVTASGSFDPSSDIFLQEHLLNEKPILPMVVAMESFAESIRDAFAKELLPKKTFVGFDGFEIIQGLVCRVQSPYRFNIHCEPVKDDETCCRSTLCGDYYNTKGLLIKDNLRYAKTDLRFREKDRIGSEKIDTGLNFTMVSDYWFDTWYPESGQVSIYHGKSLRRMGRMHYLDPFRAIAELNVPDPMELFGKRPQGVLLHAATIDAVLYACGILYWAAKKGVCLPLGIDRFRIGSGILRADEKGLAHIEMIAESNRTVQFNFTVRNSAGEMVYDVNGYRAGVLRIPQNN